MTTYGLDQVSSKGGTTGTTSSTASNTNIMGKDDFLRMLVAQLEAQDPLNPMESTDFTAQLAQFSSLEQLQNLNSALGDIGTAQKVQTNSQAVSFIGKTVSAVGDSVQVIDGSSQDLQFTLADNAAGTYITIYDQNGNYIRQIESGGLASGDQSVAWDGIDYLGGQVPDGVYTFEVSAMDKSGNSVEVTQFASGVVTGVNFEDGQAYLLIGDRKVPMGNVVQVLSEEGQ